MSEPSEPTDVIIVTVRGTRAEQRMLLAKAKVYGMSLNALVRAQLGLAYRVPRKRGPGAKPHAKDAGTE